jgi:DNA invertase Pin-like site-specific DNA recombinase
MLIGYARLCTDDESLTPQLDALRAAGCDAIFEDTDSGTDKNRKGLADALARCAAGDVLIVWKLSRLGGSLAVDLAALVAGLRERGAGLKVLTGAGAVIDTAGPDFLNILAAIAEFERDRRIEWCRRGKGRPRKLTPRDVARARRLINDGRSRGDIAALLGVDDGTLGGGRSRDRTISGAGQKGQNVPPLPPSPRTKSATPGG